MKKQFFVGVSLLALSIGSSTLQAQEQSAKTTSKYNYHDAFAPNFYTKNATETRSVSGQPGAKYWQNKADYQLTAILNEKKNEIVGTEILTYTNNSPDKISFLWMNVDQNLFKKDSRGKSIIQVS